MKVLLIKSVDQFFPLGLLYLAAELENDGIDVSILDYVVGGYNPQKFKSKLIEIKPHVVGTSCFSFNIKPAFDIAKITKETLPHVHMVMGGPHPTGLPKQTLANKYLDSIIIGEGEKTLKELVNALDRGHTLKGIKGLAYKDNGEVVFNPPRECIKDFNDVLFPAYHLIDLDPYFEYPVAPWGMHGMLTKHPRFMSIFTSRGCPYSCTYCHNIFGKPYRPRSPENVLKEIEMLYNKYGIREIVIEDDTFNIDLDRAEKILDLIIEKNLKISIQFASGLRIDRLNEKFVQKLRKAGTFMTAVGIETASPRILKQVKKHLDLAVVPDAVKLLAKHGILVWGFFMIGFLNETRKEMEQTVNFARKLKFHFISFSILIPYPGSELFEMVRDRIDIDSYFSKELTFYAPQIQLSEVSLEELKEIKKKALKKVYTPVRILRIAKTIRSINEIIFYWEKFKLNIIKPPF